VITSADLALTSVLRGDVRRQVLLAMSRFGPAVLVVSTRLVRLRNPLGGVDQGCRVWARLQSGRVLRAEAIDGSVEVAVGRSVAHLAMLVADALADGEAGGRRPLALRRRNPTE